MERRGGKGGKGGTDGGSSSNSSSSSFFLHSCIGGKDISFIHTQRIFFFGRGGVEIFILIKTILYLLYNRQASKKKKKRNIDMLSLRYAFFPPYIKFSCLSPSAKCFFLSSSSSPPGKRAGGRRRKRGGTSSPPRTHGGGGGRGGNKVD